MTVNRIGLDSNCDSCTSAAFCYMCATGYAVLDSDFSCSLCLAPGLYSYVGPNEVPRCGSCMICVQFVRDGHLSTFLLVLGGSNCKSCSRSGTSSTCSSCNNGFFVNTSGSCSSCLSNFGRSIVKNNGHNYSFRSSQLPRMHE